MKKNNLSAIDKDWRYDKVVRMFLALAVGCVLLWAPTFIVDGPGIILVAKGLVMFFGLLFLLAGLMGLWGLVTGKPLLTNRDIEEIFKE